MDLEDILDYAESWGAELAHIACTIARDYADCLGTNREDGDLLAAIVDGFKDGLRKLTEQAAKQAAAVRANTNRAAPDAFHKAAGSLHYALKNGPGGRLDKDWEKCVQQYFSDMDAMRIEIERGVADYVSGKLPLPPWDGRWPD